MLYIYSIMCVIIIAEIFIIAIALEENMQISSKNISKLFSDVRKTRFIAHRGMHSIAPQNSLPAFINAGRVGAWAIETDVHKTKDGQLVCCHNKTIDSSFNGEGEISQMTIEELLAFQINKGNSIESYNNSELRIPTFDEYLEICKKYGCVPFIELKTDIAEEVIAAVRNKDMVEWSVISSSKFEHIISTREISKSIFVHHIFSDEDKIPLLADMGNSGMSFNYKDIFTAPHELINKAHSKGVKACFRACDTLEVYQKAKELSIDYFPTNKIGDMIAIGKEEKGE